MTTNRAQSHLVLALDAQWHTMDSSGGFTSCTAAAEWAEDTLTNVLENVPAHLNDSCQENTLWVNLSNVKKILF